MNRRILAAVAALAVGSAMGVAQADQHPEITVTPVITGTEGNDGWYVSDVTVAWDVQPDDPSVVTSGCGSSDVVGDTAGVTFTCSAWYDEPDPQVVSASVIIGRDATAPSIAYTGAPHDPDTWNTEDVVLSWACDDTLSGAASASVSVIVSTDGYDQQATGTCFDAAGNSASDTQGGISIDKTSPSSEVEHVLTTGGGVSDIALPEALHGTSVEALTGVASVTVTFRRIGGHPRDVFVRTSDWCDGCGGAHARWRVPLGRMLPGLYSVEIAAVDGVGNVERAEPGAFVVYIGSP